MHNHQSNNKQIFLIVYVITIALLALYCICKLFKVFPPIDEIPFVLVLPATYLLGKDISISAKRKVLTGAVFAVFLCIGTII